MTSLELLTAECGVTPVSEAEFTAKIKEALQCGVVSAEQLNAVADALAKVAEVLR